ncbi:MAG: hypothetical protein H7326_09005 [Bdellovibrionaceae bacterium]|nr:hypothetical protein [Pseudobdellovibrionaceae bacterium]
MKIADVLKVLEIDLGSNKMDEVNVLLKAKSYKPIKYRITGENLGHYGYTGVIKAVAKDGLKVFEVNKVSLIRFADVETFEKAKPRVARPKAPKAEITTTVPGSATGTANKKTVSPKVADIKKAAPRKPNLVDPRNRK